MFLRFAARQLWKMTAPLSGKTRSRARRASHQKATIRYIGRRVLCDFRVLWFFVWQITEGIPSGEMG
ncbi:hypothetical protein CAL28_22215 [Bordetella genomosp. 11]|uniref:Uncharacterized protein n=1 Tax=Bordetella genomosp. 11 TaxID=1416808 RepID=A0A261UJ64_9BORD|nr:hypothetical protein CAL28_22215 [Bordetella genomosp. 11]